MVSVPPFEPHPWLRGGDAQTIAGRYLPGPRVPLGATYYELALSDGDRLSVLETVPHGWRPGDPAVLLIHGLCGCARAGYVVRVAARLARHGIRIIRMNLRGAGSGFGAARGIYHSGRIEDLRAVAAWTASRAPGSPVALVGFSLGANLVLKLAAEATGSPVQGLDCVLASNPPLDLARCCRSMAAGRNRLYNRNFVRGLRTGVQRLHRAFPDLGPAELGTVRDVWGFDDAYTAPRNGFADAEDYYARCSAGPLVSRIALPGLVVHSADDPFIPPDAIRSVPFPPSLELDLQPGGGHLGYISRHPWDGSRRWLDSRLVAWLRTRWSVRSAEPPRGFLPLTVPAAARAPRAGGPSRHVQPQLQ
jgi:predicted alpha/beta-fold hydrolase